MTRVIPANAAECAQILAEAARDRRTVRVIGSGTKSYIGDVAPTDIEIGTSRLAGVIDHEPADLTVTVGAGMRVADLALVLERAGQFLPLDPPHGAEATIGGVIAANSLVVRAFARIGWEWGGTWASGEDYQHFSAAE